MASGLLSRKHQSRCLVCASILQLEAGHSVAFVLDGLRIKMQKPCIQIFIYPKTIGRPDCKCYVSTALISGTNAQQQNG